MISEEFKQSLKKYEQIAINDLREWQNRQNDQKEREKQAHQRLSKDINEFLMKPKKPKC